MCEKMMQDLFELKLVVLFSNHEMSEAQRRPMTVSVRPTNGYVNGAIPSRSPTVIPEVDEFCFALGGKRAIHSILIANNGMAAVKFIRSIRTWAYETFGTDKAILLVAMATPEDMRINAEHIRIADQFVEVPGGTNNNNYANVQLIVEVRKFSYLCYCILCDWVLLAASRKLV